MSLSSVDHTSRDSISSETALRIWTSESGYRIINSYLIGSTSSRDYIYHRPHNITIEFDDITYNTIDVIDTIIQHMKQGTVEEMYYRGDTERAKSSFVSKSFIAVTSAVDQSRSYAGDECCLFKVFIDPSVKRCATGVEDELLLEPNMYWDYIGENGRYHIVRVTKEYPLTEVTVPAQMSVQPSRETLSDHELATILEDYKEECELLGHEPSSEGLVEYISNTTVHNEGITIEKAARLLGIRNGGMHKRTHRVKRKSATKLGIRNGGMHKRIHRVKRKSAKRKSKYRSKNSYGNPRYTRYL
jgi:hypothetical protein